MRKTKDWENELTSEAFLGLKELGSLIQTARKRRSISVLELSKRTGIDRRTINQIEGGGPGVSMGSFMQVLSVLGLVSGLSEALKPENDLDAIADEVRRARRKAKPKNKISDEEVNF